MLMSKVICDNCKEEISLKRLKRNDYICRKCGKYNRIPAYKRIDLVTDEDSFIEMLSDIESGNPLQFEGYDEKRKKAMENSGLHEAVITGTCTFDGIKSCIFVMDTLFMMASMGVVVGEKITALFEYATENSLPVIGYCASGGARMQEGMLSLVQMAKVSGSIKKHSEKGLLYIAVLTNPTTGGVLASFAQLGDIIIAEPNALIGFAGKRVIESVSGERLPEDFQVAEVQLENGFLDAIVKREDQRNFIINMLKLHI